MKDLTLDSNIRFYMMQQNVMVHKIAPRILYALYSRTLLNCSRYNDIRLRGGTRDWDKLEELLAY